jgi:hypothetical protein
MSLGARTEFLVSVFYIRLKLQGISVHLLKEVTIHILMRTMLPTK